MKKTIIYCDRCKKEQVGIKMWLLSESDSDKTYDICDGCVDDMNIKEPIVEY